MFNLMYYVRIESHEMNISKLEEKKKGNLWPKHFFRFNFRLFFSIYVVTIITWFNVFVCGKKELQIFFFSILFQNLYFSLG